MVSKDPPRSISTEGGGSGVVAIYYHQDAMSDPFWPGYPQALKDKIGPRNLLHSWATDKEDTTVDPRWGKVGKQKIVDEGPLPPHPIKGIKYNMETVDNEILKFSIDFGESTLGAVRIGEWKYVFIEQPAGWPGDKVRLNMPEIHNLRRDPFERNSDKNWGIGSSDYMMSFYARKFWRFVFVQQQVVELAKTAIEFPPMQKGASFNLRSREGSNRSCRQRSSRSVTFLAVEGGAMGCAPLLL